MFSSLARKRPNTQKKSNEAKEKKHEETFDMEN